MKSDVQGPTKLYQTKAGDIVWCKPYLSNRGAYAIRLFGTNVWRRISRKTASKLIAQ